jgi:hypothetical protein
MCHFITLIVPAGDQPRVAEAMRRHGRNAVPFENRSVARMLQPDEQQYLTTPGMCDCGTILAPADPGEDLEDTLAREASKLARKGWSKAKIARAIEDRRKAAANERLVEGPDSIASWAAILEELLDELRLPHAGLLVHFYSGSVDGEVFDVARRTVPTHESFADSLGSMRADEVTVWTRASRTSPRAATLL